MRGIMYSDKISDIDTNIYLMFTNTPYFRVYSNISKNNISGYPTSSYYSSILLTDNNNIYSAGGFENNGSSLFMINKETKILTRLSNIGFDSTVICSAIKGQYMCFGGYFTNRYKLVNRLTLKEVTGLPTVSTLSNNTIRSIALDNDNIYMIIDNTLKVVNIATKTLLSDYAYVSSPMGVAVDDNYIYVATGENPGLRIIDKVTKKIVNGFPYTTNIIGVALTDEYIFLHRNSSSIERYRKSNWNSSIGVTAGQNAIFAVNNNLLVIASQSSHQRFNVYDAPTMTEITGHQVSLTDYISAVAL